MAPLRRIVRVARAMLAGTGVAALAACGGGGGSASGPSLPIAAASASVATGQAPLTVSFNASGSSDPQGYALSYTWSFGDGTTATGAAVSHIFQDHGQYGVTVAVSDGHHTTPSSALPISVSAAPPIVGPTTLNVGVLGVATTVAQGTIPASDRENLPLTYTLLTPASVGSASVNATTGVITYTVSGYPSASSDQFTVQVANLDASSSGVVTVALNGDPLLPNQWHIQNTGATAFASSLPEAGNDLDVAGAWAEGYAGKGIKVGIVDTGLQASHEDLAANVDLSHSYNFVNDTDDPSPDPTSVGPDHGTEVAGIIGAVAFNGVGGRGVAYDATLRGYNFLAPTPQTMTDEVDSFGGAAFSADNDVFNASFESDGYSLPQPDPAGQAMLANTTTLRGGLGAAVVHAAGNDFEVWEAEYEDDPSTAEALCSAADYFHVSCGDTASDPDRASPVPIIVGALNADGTRASYSDTGASLWISAPGGEFGLNSGYVSGLTGATDYMPAIITTARPGCANANYPPSYSGFAAPNGVNPLDANGANPLAADCQYTATMNGTSAATPTVTAVVALMLQANPKLSVRDIKYMLAKTARHVDPTFAGVTANGITFDAGWVRNGAGLDFSNDYGFGGVDATAAVNMAATYTSYLPAVKTSAGDYAYTASAANEVVPAQSASGYPIKFTVSESFHTVETATVTLNVAQTPGGPSAYGLYCNQAQLTSPSGTTSILLHAANGFGNTSVINGAILSNAFYGEPVNGIWTLTLYDYCTPGSYATELSTSAAQTLTFTGH
jgi:PKD repeat protein